MSKVSIKGNASGTGNFSIEAPNSNVDRTLNLPDEAGTLATVENLPAGYTDTDALDLFNATGSAPVYACRAWVNFSASGTPSIRNNGNVSSITDIGLGEFIINFSTNMPSTDYTVAGCCEGEGSASSYMCLDKDNKPTETDGFGIRVNDGFGSLQRTDPTTVSIAVFR